MEHLAQHFSRVSNQLPPLADKINGLAKRLTKFSSIEPSYLVALEKWRTDAHEAVEQYYESKRRDFVDDRREKLKKEIDRVRAILEKLMRKQDAVRDDIELLTQDIRLVEQKFTEFQSLRFNIHPLVIDDSLIVRDLLPLSQPFRTMKLPMKEFSAVANNDKQFLIEQDSNLSLLDRHFSVIKQTPWTNGEIWDLCWSPSLSRFYVLTEKELYSFDQNTSAITKCPIPVDNLFYRVTCSETTLFISTQGNGPTIYEFKVPPSSKGAKEHRPPETCDQTESIFDIKANHKLLALIIFNNETGLTRLDLVSSVNFQRQWSLDVARAFRCSLLYGDEWMISDPLNRRLLHISKDGKLLRSEKYLYQPWNVFQWGKFILGVRTNDGINLH